MMLTVVSTSTCQTADGYINQRPDTFQMFHIEPLYIQNLRRSRKKNDLTLPRSESGILRGPVFVTACSASSSNVKCW